MKLYAIILLLLPFTSFSQSSTDYKNVMEKFQKFYNAAQGDSISVLFGNKWGETWSDTSVLDYLKDYGELKSIEFIGIDKQDPNRVYVFKSVLRKVGTKTISLKMDKHKELSIFRFVTSSEGINELLAKSKNGL